MSTVAALNARFGIDGVVKVVAGHGGLPAVEVTGPQGNGTVYLHGGHVAAWKPAGMEEVLWLSGSSAWADGKPIRGGVPLCFPWFGPKKDDAKAPAHGFVRLSEWELESVTQGADGVTIGLVTRSNAGTKGWWDTDYELRHIVTIGKKLTMELELKNVGGGPLVAEEAQHTYFGIGDVRQVKVLGLEGVKYIDKGAGMKEVIQQGAVTITGETDRIYVETEGNVVIEDPVKGRRIGIAKKGSKTTVVWNPWVAKAKAMPDFGDEEWPGMICVETCNVLGWAVKVEAGQSHTMATEITAGRL